MFTELPHMPVHCQSIRGRGGADWALAGPDLPCPMLHVWQCLPSIPRPSPDLQLVAKWPAKLCLETAQQSREPHCAQGEGPCRMVGGEERRGEDRKSVV